MKCNKENVRRAIKVMQSVTDDDLDMGIWSNECGTAACFAGHLGLSPDIPEIEMYDRLPVYVENDVGGEHAIAELLEIPYELASDICGIRDIEYSGETFHYISHFYGGKQLGEITPKDIIEKLELLLVD